MPLVVVSTCCNVQIVLVVDFKTLWGSRVVFNTTSDVNLSACSRSMGIGLMPLVVVSTCCNVQLVLVVETRLCAICG